MELYGTNFHFEELDEERRIISEKHLEILRRGGKLSFPTRNSSTCMAFSKCHHIFTGVCPSKVGGQCIIEGLCHHLTQNCKCYLKVNCDSSHGHGERSTKCKKEEMCGKADQEECPQGTQWVCNVKEVCRKGKSECICKVERRCKKKERLLLIQVLLLLCHN